MDDQFVNIYKNFKKFITLKNFSDGHSIAESVCRPPSINLTNQCLCECHKLDKVAIYDIYYGLDLLLKEIEIQQFGDVYNYFYEVYVTVWNWGNSLPSDVLDFERSLMKELG